MGTIIIVCPVRRQNDISIAVKVVICLTFNSLNQFWPCSHLGSIRNSLFDFLSRKLKISRVGWYSNFFKDWQVFGNKSEI